MRCRTRSNARRRFDAQGIMYGREWSTRLNSVARSIEVCWSDERTNSRWQENRIAIMVLMN